MRKHAFLCTSVLFLFQHCLSEAPSEVGSTSIDHSEWTSLLKTHVNEDGNVDYAGFLKDSLKLNTYVDNLAGNPPDEESWSEKAQIAYWINAYNAFTIKLIIQHYPLESIKDVGSSFQIPFINSPWDIKFIRIKGKKLDLNNIEHSILRKNFDEPRIHFAINCASISCPKLRREAYVAANLDEQLNEQAIDFINDEKRNLINKEKAELSKIFSWFKGDFTNEGPLIEYINKYSEIQITEKTKVSFMDYDWSLNEQH